MDLLYIDWFYLVVVTVKTLLLKLYEHFTLAIWRKGKGDEGREESRGEERKVKTRKGHEKRGKGGRGRERSGANAAAKLSVWKGIMPVLNIAARLGRQREREREGHSDSSIMLQKRCLYSKIVLFKKPY